MELDYVANNTFAQVHRDPNRYLFVKGPVGSGKTSGCIMHLFMNAMKQPVLNDGARESRYAILRSTYPAIKTTVVKSWKEWFQNLIKIVYDVPIRGEIRLPLEDGTEMHMELFFVALDREEEVNKLQSFQLTGAHMNEAAEMPQQVHQMLKSRINRFPLQKKRGIEPVNPFIICDYNSVDTEHWLYKLAEEVKPANHSFYSQPPALLMCHEREGFVCDNDGNWYKLNPDADNIENLSEEYYQDMVSGADADWVNVFVLNNYGMTRQGKPVFPAYNDALHCSPYTIKPMPALPLIIGVDCGLTPAAAFCQLTPTGQLAVIDEIVTEDTSIDSFAHNYLWPKIHTSYPNFRFMVIVDPASTTRSENDKKSAFDILKRAGFPIRTAKTNNGLARREAVNYFLHKLNGKEPGFLLSPNCITLRKGFISEYKYAKILTSARIGDRFKETPDKNIFSHCFVAGTKVSTPTGQQSIEQLSVGDFVNTPVGPRQITATMNRESNDLIRLWFSNGTTSVCTSDHPFLTSDGSIIQAKDLAPSDILIGEKDLCQTQSKNLMGSDIIKSLKDTIRPIGPVSKKLGTCTEMFGNIITAVYQKVFVFITSITTSPTIEFQTCNFCPYEEPAHTRNFTITNGKTNYLLTSLSMLTQQQQNGTALKKGYNGIVNTGSVLGKIEKLKHTLVSCVAKSMMFLRGAEKGDFVHRPVKAKHGEIQELITKTGRVRFATKPSVLINIPKPKHVPTYAPANWRRVNVTRKQKLNRCEQVYDLTVSDAHCFFANSTLVHNCHDALQYAALELSEGRVFKRMHRRAPTQHYRGPADSMGGY